MGQIGKKLAEGIGKVTSVTVSERGNAVNVENEVEEFGTVLYTTTFGPAIDEEGTTGPISIHGQIFLPDGSTVPWSGGGAWHVIGQHKWEIKVINSLGNGDRHLVVEEYDLATMSTKGTVYELD